jgi:hypothetical protein
MGVAIGDAIENRYVLDLPRGETGSGPEWQAIDMLLHRRVIVVLGPRPTAAAEGDTGGDDATAPLPIPVSNGRRVLDGGVYDGRAYLVVEFDQPAWIGESAESRIAPTAALAGPALAGSTAVTTGRFVGRPVDDVDPSTDPTPVSGLDVPTDWASPDAGAAGASRSTIALRVIGGLTAAAVAAAVLIFTVMAGDPESGGPSPALGDAAPSTTLAPAGADPAAGPVVALAPVTEAPRRNPDNTAPAVPDANGPGDQPPPTNPGGVAPTTTSPATPTTRAGEATSTAAPTTTTNTPTTPTTAPTTTTTIG